MYKIPAEGDPSLIKLRNFLDMLDPTKTTGTGKDRPEFLSLLLESSRRHADYFHRLEPRRHRYSIYDIIPRFLHLLRECVLSHNWDKATRLMEVLCKDYRTPNQMVAKVGMTSLMQVEDKSPEVLQQFVRQASSLRDIGVVEVFVEYLLHVMTQGDLDAARDQIHDLKKSTPYQVILRDPRRIAAQTLFDSYQGLVLYARWKQAVFQQEQGMINDDPLSSQTAINDLAVLTADEAIEAMEPLKNKPGVWDIFLPRVAEMLVYRDKVEEARSVLESYAKKNPSNPNSHRYLYEFEVKHGEDSELEQKYLKKLVQLDPCNPLCLTLYHMEQEDPSSVSLLFDYLDFNHCSSDRTVLELLAHRLETMSKGDEIIREAVQQCWKTRMSWWPNTVLQGARKRTHEQKEQQGGNSDADIAALKRRIYTTLKKKFPQPRER